MTLDIATTLAGLSLLGVVLGAGRIFFVVEARQSEHRDKIVKLEAVAEQFNGPARAQHERLVGRVDALEKDTSRMATKESVDALITEMRQGFRHLAELIGDRRHNDDK